MHYVIDVVISHNKVRIRCNLSIGLQWGNTVLCFDNDTNACPESDSGVAVDKSTCDIVLNTNAADEVDGLYDGQLEDVKDAGEEPENGEGL